MILFSPGSWKGVFIFLGDMVWARVCTVSICIINLQKECSLHLSSFIISRFPLYLIHYIPKFGKCASYAPRFTSFLLKKKKKRRFAEEKRYPLLSTWGFLYLWGAQSSLVFCFISIPRKSHSHQEKCVRKKNPVSSIVGGLYNQFPKPANRRRLYRREGGGVLKVMRSRKLSPCGGCDPNHGVITSKEEKCPFAL